MPHAVCRAQLPPAPHLSPARACHPQVGQALKSVVAGAGDDEELRTAAAAATGAFAKHCRCGRVDADRQLVFPPVAASWLESLGWAAAPVCA